MKRTKVMNDIIIPASFALYMYAVFKIILFKLGSINIPFLWHQLQRNMEAPIYINNRLEFANFIPLETISKSIHNLSPHVMINLYGNIAVFLPYGIFLMLMANNRRISFISVFTRSLGLSLSLECLQIVFTMGSFDVDDLILNVVGSMLGYGGFKVYNRLEAMMPRYSREGEGIS